MEIIIIIIIVTIIVILISNSKGSDEKSYTSKSKSQKNIYKCCKCGAEYDLTGVYVITLDPCPRCGGYLEFKK